MSVIMKNIMSFIIQRSKGLICNDSSKLGIILWGLLIISAIFIPEGDYFNLVLDVLKLGVSFLIFHFIFNKFTYSNNFIVRLMQKIVIYIICVKFCLYLFSFVDILDTIHCDSDDEDSEDESNKKDKNDKKKSKGNMDARTAAVTAGGLVGSAIAKTLPAAMPPVNKAVVVVGSSVATSMGTYVGSSSG